MTTIDGTLETTADGTPVLRFERRYPHPIEKVWRALTEPEEMRGWFPQRVAYDPDLRVGAKVHYSDDPNMPGESFDGEVLALEPPALLELSWGTDRLRMELRADGDGTVLVFTNTISDREHTARSAAGWHECLDALTHRLAGETPPWTDNARWAEVHPAYVERFGGE
jgi:uncharacterized protein YndB with AHSA1/START domain